MILNHSPSWSRLCCFAALGLAGQAHGQAGLTKTDINNPVTGIVTANPDASTTVTAGGGDTYGTADSFTYLHEQRTGDFDVKVLLHNVDADDPTGQQTSAKGSLQVRASLSPGSPNIQVSGIPDPTGAGYVETISRPSLNGETEDPPLSAPDYRYFGGPYPGTFRPASGSLYSVWLRVRRTGDLFQTMSSKDGITWTVLAEYATDPAAFPATVYVGLAAVAHIDSGENQNHRVRSTFSDYGNAAKPPVATQGGSPVTAGNVPGVYPVNSVTGVNWNLSIPSDGIGWTADKSSSGPIVWNTQGFASISRDLILDIDSQGPVAFSTGRYATGAIDFGISPRDPVSARSNLGPYTNPNRDRDTPAVTDPASQAWFPSLQHGILIPTVRVNGTVSWNDGASPFFPHTYQAVDFSSANSYHMQDGTFGNGRLYTRMAKRGDTGPHPNNDANGAGGFQRAAFSISTAWFPYEDGWMSGYFANAQADGSAFWQFPGAHSPAASQGTAALDPNSAGAILQWTQLGEGGGYGGLATLSLPGVDSRDDGMLFLVPNDDTTSRGPQANCAIKPDGSGWTIGIREVAFLYSLAEYISNDRSEFSFLHIPYTATNLIGGEISGANGSKIHSGGDFTVTRPSTGRYEISIPGKTGQSGMLILQAVGNHPEEPEYVDTASLSYEYNSQTNRFVVESRVSDPTINEGFAVAPLRDSNFYFAWVDFSDPLTLTPDILLPELSIQNNGASVTVSWPTAITGYVLETSNNLANPWTDVPGVTANSVTLPYTPSLKKQFFRLRPAP
ncbi:hypothetical protein [Luteolibacter luteus]|uniref:Uncharacterized protein n=1 Tax=Luteolibacter luteus TaxID=2728835 RepID=A0A858RPY5_9BACT|nr:hypothetical protein [Luteolibacter luteus]QJE98190.1 hypothetical protein HHL09_21170 [Luteolibacter luteus]